MIPKGWHRPVVPTTAEGRNWALVRALLRFAGSARHSEADIRREADRLYGELDIYRPHYFSRTELYGVVQSVLRQRQRWAKRPGGWHSPAWLRQ